jgi:hypothetical protein
MNDQKAQGSSLALRSVQHSADFIPLVTVQANGDKSVTKTQRLSVALFTQNPSLQWTHQSYVPLKHLRYIKYCHFGGFH